MKKVFGLLLLFLAFFAFACSNGKKEDNDNSDKKDDETVDVDIEQQLETIKLPSEVDSNINLPKEIKVNDDITITLTWESNNNAITSNGIVTRSDSDVIVTLKVKGTFEDKSFEKTFTIKVIKEEKSTNLDDIFNKAKELLVIPSEAYKDFTLPKSIKALDCDVTLSYESDNSALTSEGKVTLEEETDSTVNLKVTFSYNNETSVESYTITVPSMATLCQRVYDDINIPSVVDVEYIELTQGNDIVTVEWTSSLPRIISTTGKCAYISSETTVKLSAIIYIEQGNKSYFLDKEYNVTVKSWKAEYRLAIAKANLTVPEEATDDLYLPIKLDYDVLCQWTSSDDTVISPVGYVMQQDHDEEIILFAKLYTSDSNQFESLSFVVKVPKLVVNDDEEYFKYHNLVVKAKDFVKSNLNGLVYDEATEKVKLASGALSGSYESKIYKIHDAYEIVGSYNCITSPNATCECSYSLRVDGTWSKYFSYGDWGLGKQNYYYNQEDTLVSMDVDEIQVKNGKTADAVKFKFTLKRTSGTIDSPEMAMVACCLFLNDYTYRVDESQILPAKDWDVPKLYQHDVPNIGGVICSPTTTTMLLKFMGMSFKDKGYTYEHEYIARMAADPGHNSPTYGNWSYNMITAGALGATAYVARIYSVEELKYHLCTVGPIGASIRGNFGIYTTGGHLIVVRGYRDEGSSTTIICNDPNVKGVYYEVSLDIFLGAWRNMAYIFEY